MDTNGKAIRTLQISIALVAMVSLGGPLPRAAGTSIPGREGIMLLTPGTDREALLEWAVKRYRAAGLLLPAVRVAFHTDSDGCRGNVGYQVNGLIDLCVRLAMESGPERIVLHELAHAWCDEHLTDAARVRFMQSRRITSWNGSTADWRQRGYEQAAEIIAWGLGDGTLHPLIDGANDPDALAAGFRILTSVDPLR